MDSRFSGVGVAMVTPFNEDKSIDFDSLEKLTSHLVSGADFLVVMGTTGENPTISNEEQAKVLDLVKQVNGGKLPIVFGIGGNDTEAVKNRMLHTDLSGVDGILSVSPYYSKPNQEGIFQHFKTLSEVSPLPIILYNVPGRTGSTISADTTLRISELPNMVATKEASGSFDIVMDLLRRRRKDFMILSGDDDLTMPYVTLGAEGVISVIGNAYPKEFSDMVKYASAGELAKAQEIHFRLLPMIKAIFMDGNPGGVKYLLSKMGLCKNIFRSPVYPVNEATRKAIDDAFAKL